MADTKTVSYRNFQKEVHNVERWINQQLCLELGSEDVSEYIQLENIKTDGSIQMAVNWSALGSISPEGTRTFAEWLDTAADEAERFYYNGYQIAYGEEDYDVERRDDRDSRSE